jgi:hypothetical protein
LHPLGVIGVCQGMGHRESVYPMLAMVAKVLPPSAEDTIVVSRATVTVFASVAASHVCPSELDR